MEKKTSRHIWSDPRRLNVRHRRVHKMHRISDGHIRRKGVSSVAGGEKRAQPIGRRTPHGAAERENGREFSLQPDGRFKLPERRQNGAQSQVTELSHGRGVEKTRDGGNKSDADVPEENAPKEVENAVFGTLAPFQKGDQLRAKLQVQAFRRNAGFAVAQVEEVLGPDALRPLVPVFLDQIGG